MTQLTDESLRNFVKTGPCLLFYYTDWCPMCPAVREILATLPPCLRRAQLCYDDCPEAVCLHDVPGVPSVVALREGASLVLPGLRPKEHYTTLAAQLLA